MAGPTDSNRIPEHPASLFAGSQPDAGADSLVRALPADWREVLGDDLRQPWFAQLAAFVQAERNAQEVFPAADDVFNALKHTSYADTRVLLLGQDPYHDVGQAQGLCFSVRPGVRPPPSLMNIFKELKSDLGFSTPSVGCLTRWADQGVLLLNAVMTVRAHAAASHKGQGWETFTDAIIQKLNARRDPVIFVLWGVYAQKKENLIDPTRHTIIKSAHPSPLSARTGFFGSKPFSKINETLRQAGQREIDWRIETS